MDCIDVCNEALGCQLKVDHGDGTPIPWEPGTDRAVNGKTGARGETTDGGGGGGRKGREGKFFHPARLPLR